MKTAFFSVALIAVCASSLANPLAPKFDTTTLMVKMKPGTSGRVVDALIGATEVRAIPEIGWRTIRIPQGRTLDWAFNFYRNNPSVASVEKRPIHRLKFTPNDPDMPTKQYAPQIMETLRAWDLTRGASSVIVSIIDTGIDPTHPEFAGKLLPGYDFSDGDSDPTDDLPIAQYANHGSHCAGIAAAATNNGIGMAGIGFNARILPVKIFPNAFADTSAQAIIYSANQGAKVISMSYGSYAYSQVENDAVNYAYARNATLFAAVGNDNVSIDQIPHYPSNYPNVVAVGSTDAQDQKSGFSNFGNRVDMAAPGSDIYSTINVANGSFGYLSGTSMACPAAAGVAALVYAYAPSTTRNRDIVNAMKRTAKPVGTWLSNGRVNAFRSVNEFTVSTPIPAVLLSKAVFDGTATTGTGAFMNVRTRAVRGVGNIAAVIGTFRMPTNSGALRRVNLKSTFGAVRGATAQMYLWNYKTNQYDLMRSVPADNGVIDLEMSTMNSAHLSVRDYRQMLRIVSPQRAGTTLTPFVFAVNTMTGTFSFSQNNP